MRVRARVYGAGWAAQYRLPLPTVGIGSLQVGGAGKTPLASWTAAWFLARGARPAVLLRDYGGDEGPLHRILAPGAIVVADADRRRGATAALAQGAQVAVLDDNAQHLRVIPDRQMLLLNAETLRAARAVLPAGPWRQRWDTGTAHVIVVTRKVLSASEAEGVRSMVRRAYPDAGVAQAHLSVAGWRPLHGGPALPTGALAGRSLFALCGVADPRSFAAHVRGAGRLVGARLLRDHARYRPSLVRRVVRAAESAGVDYVVTTAKDAVKLRPAWPADGPPVLVADLVLSWDVGEALVTSELEACLPGAAAGAGPSRAAERAAAGSA